MGIKFSEKTRKNARPARQRKKFIKSFFCLFLLLYFLAGLSMVYSKEQKAKNRSATFFFGWDFASPPNDSYLVTNRQNFGNLRYNGWSYGIRAFLFDIQNIGLQIGGEWLGLTVASYDSTSWLVGGEPAVATYGADLFQVLVGTALSRNNSFVLRTALGAGFLSTKEKKNEFAASLRLLGEIPLLSGYRYLTFDPEIVIVQGLGRYKTFVFNISCGLSFHW